MIRSGLRCCQTASKQPPCGPWSQLERHRSWKTPQLTSFQCDHWEPWQMTYLRSFEIRRGNFSTDSSPAGLYSSYFFTFISQLWAKIALLLQGSQWTMSQYHTLPWPVARAIWMHFFFFFIQKVSCSERRVWVVAHGHRRSQRARMDLRLLGDLRKWKPKGSWISRFFFDQSYTILSIQLVLSTWSTDFSVGFSAGIWHHDTTLLKSQFTERGMQGWRGGKNTEKSGQSKRWDPGPEEPEVAF